MSHENQTVPQKGGAGRGQGRKSNKSKGLPTKESNPVYLYPEDIAVLIRKHGSLTTACEAYAALLRAEEEAKQKK